MKVKILPGTFGLGLTYDRFAGAVYLTLFTRTFRFARPVVGICLHCNHQSQLHRATRSGGMISWMCMGLAAGVQCPCDYYHPQSV